MHPTVSNLIGAPVIGRFPNVPSALEFVAEYCIFFGQFGVAIFFIISGLVIPFSFEKCARKDFLIRRDVRIYPVYIAGFCFSMMSLYFLSKYIGVSYKFSLFDIVAHFGVITRAPLDVARID